MTRDEYEVIQDTSGSRAPGFYFQYLDAPGAEPHGPYDTASDADYEARHDHGPTNSDYLA